MTASPPPDPRPRLRVAAYAVAVREAAILLTRLSEAAQVFEPGAWHLPGGGIDPGEQPTEALAREVGEETGLALTDARLLDARSYAVERLGVGWQVIALFYAVGLSAGVPTVTEIGGSSEVVAWVPLRGIGELTLTPPAADGLGLIGTRPG